MKHLTRLRAFALALLLSGTATGCLEVTISKGPQEPTQSNIADYPDVARNPATSPYYTEPILPLPGSIAEASLVSMAPQEPELPAERSNFDSAFVGLGGDVRRVANGLLKYDGVVGTGVEESSHGEATILVLTEDAASKERIPSSINGARTDVRVVGKVKALAYATRDKHRPVIPTGVSVGNGRENSSGTIGAVVMKNGIRYMLSNNHVLARQNRAQIGEQIVQPGRADTRGIPTEPVAILSAFKPVNFSGSNRMDAAIARYLDYHSYSMIDKAFAPSQVVAAARTGLQVKKMGRTTGLTSGSIVGTNVSVKVEFDGKTALFENQIYIKSDVGEFLKAGDSGSLLVTANTNQPVGLCFAGGEGSAFANPIQPILDHFGVTIVGR